MGQPMAGKLVYGAHQLTMQDMADATTAPLLASPADNLAQLADTQRAGVGRRPSADRIS
jgi:hypothetical protein